MINKIFEIFANPLIKGSTIVLVGSLLGNLLNFLFNLFMSRNLSVSDYGTLASLISLISLFGLLGGSVTPTIVNFAAIYFANKKLDNAKALYFKVSKLSFLIGLVSLTAFIVFTKQIGEFFNIHNSSLVLLAGLNIFIGFIAVANIPLLQAKLLFKFIVFINTLASFSKLLIGMSLVFLGFAVGGVMWAYFISSLLPYVLSFIPLRFLFQRRKSFLDINFRTLLSYAAPTSLALFGLSSFITSDIILVKHFFNPTSAGMYAGLSLIGRVIYFLSAPISTVMFPLVVHRHARNEKYIALLVLSLIVVFLPSIAFVASYFVLPDLVVKIFLKKDEYLAIAPLLGFFGIFITTYSLLVVTTNFYLSIKKTKVFIPLLIGAFFQILLIFLYHSSFSQIIFISFGITFFLLMSFLFYYLVFYAKQDLDRSLRSKFIS